MLTTGSILILLTTSPLGCSGASDSTPSANPGDTMQVDSAGSGEEEEGEYSASWNFPICGAPNDRVPGYVPHGDPLSNGTVDMQIDRGRLTISIDLGEQRYYAHHAHLYSTTSGYLDDHKGASTVCWAWDNLTENVPETAPYNEKALGVVEWPQNGSYAWGWYMNYLFEIEEIEGGEWYVMVHMLGGHFAVDDDGHLIEWDPDLHEVVGDEDVPGNFGGENDVHIECNARHGRTLDDRNVRTGNSCISDLGEFNEVEEPFLDQNGVAWLDSEGNPTADAADHGYDLTTQYLFYSFADDGIASQYGGPEGGAGGFVNGYEGERCDDWPPTGWGDPHAH